MGNAAVPSRSVRPLARVPGPRSVPGDFQAGQTGVERECGQMQRIAVGKALTSAIVGASLLVGQIGLASPASAGDRHRSYRPYDHAPRFVDRAPRHYGYGYQHERHRDRTGDAVAGVVLGIGALIVGAAIADAARNKHRAPRHYED